jgi:hypothetical protein
MAKRGQLRLSRPTAAKQVWPTNLAVEFGDNIVAAKNFTILVLCSL